MNRLAQVAGVGVYAWLVTAAAAKPPAAPTIEDIKAVWQARQDKVKTVRVEWTTKHTLPKGYLDEIAKLIPSAKPSPHPPRDMSLDGTGSLTLGGQRFRVDTDMMSWSAGHGEALPATHTLAFDGEKYLSITRRSPGSTHQSAYINPKTYEAGELNQAYLRPLFWAWRGTDAKFTPSPLDLYDVTGRTITVQSRPCVEVCRTRRSTDQRHYLLLDRDRGYVVAREYVSQGNAVLSQTDTTYRADAVSGWVPDHWEWSSQSARGRAGEATRCEVTRVEVNADLPADTFSPPLEPGTHVGDTRGGGAETMYVVQADGRPGVEVPGTQKITYEELAELRSPVQTVWVPLALGVGGAVGLGLLVALVYRRWRRNAVRETGPQE